MQEKKTLLMSRRDELHQQWIVETNPAMYNITRRANVGYVQA